MKPGRSKSLGKHHNNRGANLAQEVVGILRMQWNVLVSRKFCKCIQKKEKWKLLSQSETLQLVEKIMIDSSNQGVWTYTNCVLSK